MYVGIGGFDADTDAYRLPINFVFPRKADCEYYPDPSQSPESRESLVGIGLWR